MHIKCCVKGCNTLAAVEMYSGALKGGVHWLTRQWAVFSAAVVLPRSFLSKSICIIPTGIHHRCRSLVCRRWKKVQKQRKSGSGWYLHLLDFLAEEMQHGHAGKI